jgi:hypothetical protein
MIVLRRLRAVIAFVLLPYVEIIRALKKIRHL